MKSSMPSLRYMEMVVNDGACGRASMQWQTFEDWVVRVLARSDPLACGELTSRSVKVRNLEIMRQTSLVGLCISYTGAGSTSTISVQHRNRIIHIARLLTRTISTLQYIGVGYHDGNSGMYASDCLWFRATGRDAEASTPATLQQLSSADGERRREILLSTQRDEDHRWSSCI
ncbi:hypothetical protein BD311DRAFT_384191 [Dichomitus squalens]|uniref:Uncharacterized protein n=1 Tax=Dichomitus squalens TaxID=114155 RepID=A0A4Q9MMK7_9APHY|nr:hypothetical protein BD311DRAFT_384191 [Dichomitus squalens]